MQRWRRVTLRRLGRALGNASPWRISSFSFHFGCGYAVIAARGFALFGQGLGLDYRREEFSVRWSTSQTRSIILSWTWRYLVRSFRATLDLFPCNLLTSTEHINPRVPKECVHFFRWIPRFLRWRTNRKGRWNKNKKFLILRKREYFYLRWSKRTIK